MARASLSTSLGIGIALGAKLSESFLANFTDREDIAKLIAFRRDNNGR